MKSGAIEVILEGADSGAIAEYRAAWKKSILRARSIPLGKAMDDVLLAFRMNGQPGAGARFRCGRLCRAGMEWRR